MNTKKKNLTKQICVLALLTAAGVVLGRLVPVINLWNTKIEFAFVAVMLAACISGPIGGAVIGALVDFIGAILMPTGAYFPGFTVTAAITGLVFGLLLYKKINFPRIVIAGALHSACLRTASQHAVHLNSLHKGFHRTACNKSDTVRRDERC